MKNKRPWLKIATGSVLVLALAALGAYLFAPKALISLASTVPTPNILLMHLDEPVGSTAFSDSSGNGNEATCTGNCSMAGANGKFNNGLDISANSSPVTASDSASLDTTDAITVEAWLNPKSLDVSTRKKIIDIAGVSGELTNYQVELTVEYESEMQADYDDLVFIGEQGSPLDFWLQESDSSSATVWVEVPTIPTSGTSITMYYGSSEMASLSDGEATFLFWDDFEDGVYTDKWEDPAGQVNGESNGTIEVGGCWDEVYSKQNIPDSVTIVGKGQSEDELPGNKALKMGYGDDQTYEMVVSFGDNFFELMEGDGQIPTWDIKSNTDYVYEQYVESGYLKKATFSSLDGTQTRTATGNVDATSASPVVSFSSCGAGGLPIYFDYIFARAYSDTEPTAIFNEEETTGINKPGSYGIGANDSSAYASINGSVISGNVSSGWNHVVLTYDKSAGKQILYINGNRASETSLSESIAVTDSDLLFGESYIGGIDEVAIYNRALSADEVLARYNYDPTSGGDGDSEQLEQQNLILTPRDEGGPHVRVVDARGKEISSFMAYSENFRGSFKAIGADVDGDGKDEIVTAPGEGFGPQVRVLEIDKTPLGQFFSYDESEDRQRNGINIAAGDVNGDGKDEIIVYPLEGSRPSVRVYSYEGEGKFKQIDWFWAYDQGFRGGVNIAVGNIDGDSNMDIVTAPTKGSSNVRVYEYTAAENKFNVLDWTFAYQTSFTGGVNLSIGDIDGNNRDNIITAPASEGGSNVRAYNFNTTTGKLQLTDWRFAYEQEFKGGINVAAGDLDGDGNAEIATAPTEEYYPSVRVYTLRDGQITTVDYLMVYDINFQGGANLLIKELTGDNKAELVTAPAKGSANVRIYNVEETFQLYDWFWGYDEGFKGGTHLSAGVF